MAVIRGKSPVIMTAVGDSLTPANEGLMHWKVTQIRVANAAASGDVLLLDKAGGTRDVLRGTGVAANSAVETSFGMPVWFKDIYVSALPAGASVEIFYV